MTLERRYIFAAVLLHVALFLFLFISAHFNHKMEPPAVIQAVFVQSPQGKMQAKEKQDQQVQEEIKQQKKAEQQKQAEQQQKILQQQQRKLAQEQQQKQAQEQQKLEQQQKQVHEQQQKLLLQQKQEQQAKELAAQKLAQQQKEKALEQERLLKQQQEQFAKELQQEQQRQIDQTAKQLAAEKAERLKQQQAMEQKRIADMRADLNNETNARLAAAQKLRQETWGDKIAAIVKSHWIRPYGSPDVFQCKVKVQLLPGGSVVGATVIDSCGNSGLDASVVRAVLKSDPLPMPDNPEDFTSPVTIIFEPNNN